MASASPTSSSDASSFDDRSIIVLTNGTDRCDRPNIVAAVVDDIDGGIPDVFASVVLCTMRIVVKLLIDAIIIAIAACSSSASLFVARRTRAPTCVVSRLSADAAAMRGGAGRVTPITAGAYDGEYDGEYGEYEDGAAPKKDDAAPA